MVKTITPVQGLTRHALSAIGRFALLLGLAVRMTNAANCFDDLKFPFLLGSTDEDEDSLYYAVTGVDNSIFLGGSTQSPTLTGSGVLTS